MAPWAIALLATGAAASALAQSPATGAAKAPVVAVFQAASVPFSNALLQQIKLPPGFEISVFAKGLGNVRWLQAAPNGDVYASRRTQGDVVLLRDTNGDGVADVQTTVARNALAHGLLLHDGQHYIASDRALCRAEVKPDGTLAKRQQLLDDLPPGGNHPRRTLGMGPDGWLYLSVGSTCNHCAFAHPENATLLRLRPDGTQRETFARGLRKTLGFGWHPATGQLCGFDHGSDLRGDEQPPEEPNSIVRGKHCGWPWCLGARVPDPVQTQNPPGTSKPSAQHRSPSRYLHRPRGADRLCVLHRQAVSSGVPQRRVHRHGWLVEPRQTQRLPRAAGAL